VKQRALRILWPAFLGAGVLEMLVFAVVDPHDLRWFGGPPIDWEPLAIYSVTFLIFWAGIATSGALTALLSLTADDVNGSDIAPFFPGSIPPRPPGAAPVTDDLA
jgi:hypothetical protein